MRFLLRHDKIIDYYTTDTNLLALFFIKEEDRDYKEGFNINIGSCAGVLYASEQTPRIIGYFELPPFGYFLCNKKGKGMLVSEIKFSKKCLRGFVDKKEFIITNKNEWLKAKYYYNKEEDALYFFKGAPKKVSGIKIPTEDEKAGVIFLLNNEELEGIAIYGCKHLLKTKLK